MASVPDNTRDALFKATMLRQAIERGDTALVVKLKFDLKPGDLVQMSRLGISRQNSSGSHPKTEDTSGTLVRFRTYLYRQPKYPAAIVQWHHIEGESETRIDYLEPLGTPR